MLRATRAAWTLTAARRHRWIHASSVAPRAKAAPPPFAYTDLFQLQGDDPTPYRRVAGTDGLVSVDTLPGGREVLRVKPEALTLLAREAMVDIAHLLRPGHLAQLARILEDPEASKNDRFVALQLLKNANIAASGILPGCQDTGTAIVVGKRGCDVLVDGDASDEEALSRGIYETYTERNLRYSQNAPLSMFKEKNTGTNLPAQLELYATRGAAYDFLFMAKGGGSANKTFLYQQTKSVLNDKSLMEFLEANIKTIGTSACPPYHLAIVVGGLSAEMTLKTVKLASARYLDRLPTTGDETGACVPRH